jgi:hypothetical protein
MTDARASHINAKQGTVKAQNAIKQGQLNKAISPSDGVVGRLVQRMSQGSPYCMLLYMLYGILECYV